MMTEQEKADITLVSWGEEGENMFSSLPWERRTEAVSLRAVETWAGNLKYVPEDVLTEEICLAAVRKDGELLERVPEPLRTRRVCLAAVNHYGWALESVPERMRTREICRAALRAEYADSAGLLGRIPYPDVCREGFRLFAGRSEHDSAPAVLRKINPYMLNEGFALEAVQKDPACLAVLPKRLRTQKVCMAAIRRDGSALDFVPEPLRTKRMCREAVKTTGRALEYVPEKLRTPAMYAEAVGNDCRVLDYIPQAKHTRRLYRKALEGDGLAIRYFEPGLLTREMCDTALACTSGLQALRYIPFPEIHERLLESRDGYLEVKEFLDSMNPEYMTPKLARMIFTKEPELFFDIPERFKDRDMCEAAVRYDGTHLRMVPEKLKTPELCREAIRHSAYAIRHIPESMKTPELYRELVAENPRNLHGIPEEDRTYELCKTAFDNTYGRDKSDYSVAGALVEPSLALQMVREQDDPGTIDFLMDIMCSKAISEEVALEAVRKNGHILRFVPQEVITQQIGEAAVGNHPEAIRWVPYGIRTADMCLYAFRSDSNLDVYTPSRIRCEDNIYLFARKMDELLRQPISYDDSKRLYAGEPVRLRNVETDTGTFADCEVRYNSKDESLKLRNLTPRQERTQPVKPQRKPALKPKF